MIIPQQPAKSFATFNLTVSLADLFARLNDLVAKTLVVSFAMIMEQKFLHCFAERTLTEENHLGKTFRFDAQVKSLEMSAQIWRFWGKPHRLHASLLEHGAKYAAKVVVAIHQNILLSRKKPSNGSVRFLATCFIKPSPNVALQAAK